MVLRSSVPTVICPGLRFMRIENTSPDATLAAGDRIGRRAFKQRGGIQDFQELGGLGGFAGDASGIALRPVELTHAGGSTRLVNSFNASRSRRVCVRN